MRKVWLTCGMVYVLGACSDPMSLIETVPQDAPLTPIDASAALPSAAELAREETVLVDLFGNDERLPEGDVVDDAVIVAGTEDTTDVEEQAVDLQADIDATVAGVVPSDPARKQGGVLGWLRRAANAETEADGDTQEQPVITTSEAQDVSAQNAPDDLASLDTEPLAPTVAAETPARSRVGAGNSTARSGPDARDVPLGATLAFGEIARVCEAKPAQLGKLVDQGARKGRGYKLFDTVPDGSGLRTFYVTGFADNCPRQFTASLALFGAPEFHEQLRYGLPSKEYPYSTTDKAYEKVKAKVCNVGRNKPCGSRISRLDRTTVFVSAYENFGENARWADMLLHDGAVVAASLKTP